MRLFRQKTLFIVLAVLLVTGVQVARAQTSDSMNQFDNSGSGQSSGSSSGQNCWASEEEMINAPSSMANFDKPMCAGAGAGTSANSNSATPASDLSQFDNPKGASTANDPFAQFGTSPSATDPMNQFDKPSTTGLNRMPAGTVVSYDLASLVGQLQPGQTIIHLPNMDTLQGSAYAIVPNSAVASFEANANQAGMFDFNASGATNGVSNPVVSTIISALNTLGISSYIANSNESDMISTLQSTGSTYSWFSSLQNQVTALPGGADDANLQNIYNLVEQNLTGNQAVANNYTQAESLATAIGVCRDQATDLAVLLSDKGYNSSVVVDGNHAWVRVNYNNSTFDLDPNGYYTYTQLPPRTISSSNQVIPVKPSPNP